MDNPPLTQLQTSLKKNYKETINDYKWHIIIINHVIVYNH